MNIFQKLQNREYTVNQRILLSAIAGSVALTNNYYLSIIRFLEVDVLSRFVIPLMIFIFVGIYNRGIPAGIYASGVILCFFALELYLILMLPVLFNLFFGNIGLLILLNLGYIVQALFFSIFTGLLGSIIGSLLYEFI